MQQPGCRRFLPCVSLAVIFITGAIWSKPPFLFGPHHHGGFVGGVENLKAMTAEGDFSLLEGFWLGTIEEADLRILYRITRKGIVYNYSLDQGGALPLR